MYRKGIILNNNTKQGLLLQQQQQQQQQQMRKQPQIVFSHDITTKLQQYSNQKKSYWLRILEPFDTTVIVIKRIHID